MQANAASVAAIDDPGVINTRFLLAVAALLITNSHLEKFYPVPILAGDGLLGNSIFFMVAGLGVALSFRKRTQSFGDYYVRRIKRIYPTVLVVVTVFLLLWQQAWRTWGLRDYLINYIYPTRWAFIHQVMLLYVLFYPLVRRRSPRLMVMAFIAAYLAFIFAWAMHPQVSGRLQLGSLHWSIYWPYWFQMMILGGFLANARADRQPPVSIYLWIAAAGLLLYLSLKFLFVTGRVSQMQFVLFPIVQVIAFALVKIAQSPAVHRALRDNWLIGATVVWIGTRTLEIYTVQTFFVDREDLAQLSFPLNLIAIWLVIFAAAWIVHAIVSLLTRQRDNRVAVT